MKHALAIALAVMVGALGAMFKLAEPIPVMSALLHGALHECKIRGHNEQHDAINRGMEVQSSMMTLIRYLNRCAHTRPEPTPNDERDSHITANQRLMARLASVASAGVADPFDQHHSRETTYRRRLGG
jgi:hypothetical protein